MLISRLHLAVDLTTLLYLLLTSFPPFSASSTKIASSSIFLSSLSSYLGHPDKTVRGLGMMFAEIVSEQTIREDDTIVATGEAMKRLRFGIWEGEGEWRKVAKRIRSMEGDWVAKGEAHDPLVDGEAMIGWAQTTTRASPSQPKSHPSPRSSPPPKPVPPPKSTKSKKPKRIEPLSDSDDSLSGYLSSSSTTSSTFEPENLDQYLTDPTLYTPAKKLPQRPVYLAQLLSYLSAREDPDKLDCALKWGEALVRRKRGFGLELEENAVGLSVYLAGLDDGFELVDFENRKQGLMNALVACEPRKTAPCVFLSFLAVSLRHSKLIIILSMGYRTLIEQYFGSQYSLHQRSAILEALAMGAREVASLPTLKAPNQPSIDWPSKKLPPALHDKFVSGGDVVRPPLLGGEDAKGKGRLAVRGRIEEAARELGGEAIEKGREEAEEKVGEIRREKQLRVRQKTTASATAAPSPQTPHPTSTAFQDVAAEYFLLPLINRLWTHYTEQCTLRHRFATTTQAHTSAGTGMILSPLSLSKLLATLSVLSHAARHSPVFLAVLAPQLLELAVKLGASPLAASSSAEFSAEGEGEEVSVLTTSLELTLVTLDVSRDLDGGRTLMVDHGGLIEAAAEWGEMVFRRTESGQRVMGEGRGGEGFDEGVAGVRRASAGVCVIVGEMKERWGRLVGF
jgi:telomere length regulation protein